MMYRPVIFILISVSSVLCQIDQFRSRPQACLEAPLPGTCRALLPRFYFNPLTGSCDCFIYGGCQGGRNNFQVLAQCMQTCGVHPSTQFSSDACNRIFPSFPSVDIIPSVTIPVIATTESNFNNVIDLRNPVEQRGTQSPLTNENMDRLQEIFNQASQQHIQGLDNVATHKIEPQQPLNDGAAHRIPPPQVINDGAAHKIPPPQQGLNDGAAHRIPPPQPERSSDEQQAVTSRPVTTGRPLRPVTQFPVTRRPVTRRPVSTTTLRPTTTFAQKVQEGQRQQLAQTIEEQKQRQAIQQQVQQDQLEDQRKTQQELLERHFGTGVRVRQATGGRIN